MRFFIDVKKRILVTVIPLLIVLVSMIVLNILEKQEIVYYRAMLDSEIANTQYKITKLQKPRCGEYFCMSPEDFFRLAKKIESNFLKQGILIPNPERTMFGDGQIHRYIAGMAEALGYEQKPFIQKRFLVQEESFPIHPQVQDSFHKLRDAMEKDTLKLSLVSAYRNYEHQEFLFLQRLGVKELYPKEFLSGLYDELLREVLKRTAPPGYSKHHTGFALDFACGHEMNVFNFKKSPCYEWMSLNNFERMKSFGFIPSYPEGIDAQGPEPEAWEYLWVGDTIR